MILGTLFAALVRARRDARRHVEHRARQSCTSDGLQRQRFVPTIKLLRKHREVVHVDGAIDYRLRVLERADVYQTPNGAVGRFAAHASTSKRSRPTKATKAARSSSSDGS